MSADRHYSPIDRFLLQADSALRTLLPFSGQPARPSPAIVEPDGELSEEDTRHIAGLMRINHTGEVCAQALYQGQSLTAKLPEVREAMEEAAEEEIDHLAWCEQRIRQLGSRPSVLNPIFYGLVLRRRRRRLVSDRVSLGFVAATEDQVCKHLDEHLAQIPQEDRPCHPRADAYRRGTAFEQRPGRRRPALPGTGEAGHEPAGEGDDQEHLPHLNRTHEKPASKRAFSSRAISAACCARRRSPAFRA